MSQTGAEWEAFNPVFCRKLIYSAPVDHCEEQLAYYQTQSIHAIRQVL